MDKKIAVIGSTGFVGKATSFMLRSRGATPVEYHVDEGVSATRREVNACAVAFVCVPTPMAADGTCDLSIIKHVLSWLETPLIVIKSTVPIGTTTALREATGKNIVHSPEFLREATAEEDAKHPQFMMIGGDSACLEELYKQWFECPIIITTPEYSEATKYAINVFLAYKVGFFNELWHLLNTKGMDVDMVTTYMLHDRRIGDSHTLVTNEGGFGGHCFPKDLNAFIASFDHDEYDPKLFKQLWRSNREWRQEFAGEEFNLYG